MKTLFRLPLLAIALTSILLASCNFNTTDKDENIDPTLKSTIQKLNHKLIQILDKGDELRFREIASKALLESANDSLTIILADFKDRFTNKKFTILNEFHQKNSAVNSDNIAIATNAHGHDYKISYKGLALESYVCTIYFEDKISESCFTLVYGKYGNDWKLNIMQGGVLTYEEKDAIDWYETAKAQHKKGHFIDAAISMSVANTIKEPGGKFWDYEETKDLNKFNDQLVQELDRKFKFPMPIKRVSSNPHILSIFPEIYDEGIFPTIAFQTRYELSDTAMLHKEFNELHEVIGKVFPGFDQNNKGVMYKAFYTLPKGDEQEQFYYCQKDF